jgi:Domain of Unknown Function with PDB structure (DUF3857)/Transglutaminase-like superfamily
MKKIIFLCPILLFFSEIQAQTELDIYAAASIPKELLLNANAVIRKFDLTYEVKDLTHAIEKEHKIVTILNEKGKRYGEPVFSYDKFSSIEDIEANFYDKSGKLVRKLKKRDIKDVKNYDQWIDDDRYKLIEFPHLPYPYTIEYTVETRKKQTMFYPSWMPQTDNNDAVESATLTVTMPEGLTLRYKAINVAENVEKTGNTYKWYLKNVKTFHIESYTPSILRYLPMVILAPTEFEIGGFKGQMDTWKDLGLFQNTLNKDRQDIPLSLKEKIREMVKDCPDEYCKIEKIYDYLQNTTRYFSIQLGVGGWQPISATDVDKAKYGDCKGLSNYMIAMLDVVGIKAHHVLLNRGSNDFSKERMQTDFPAIYFNHMMACVPLHKDTVWLECTNQTTAAGYLERTDDDRSVLVITPEGGKVTRTPKSDEKVNIENRVAKVQLNSDGGALITSKTLFNGLTQDFYLMELDGTSDDAKKKELYERMKINNFEVKEIHYSKIKKPKPYVVEDLILNVSNLASVSGKRLFIPFNIFSQLAKNPLPDSARQFDVQADDRGFTEQDSVTFQLPEGFKPETKPTPLSITSPFGSFEMTITEKSPTELVFYRKFILNNKILPKEKFPELVEFLKNVAKADKGKLILVKTTS